MADNFIAVTVTNNRMASSLREIVDGLSRYHHRLQALKADMDQMTDGANWTTLEAQFGLAAGKGSSVYNLVTGANAEIAADTTLQQLLSWLAAMP